MTIIRNMIAVNSIAHWTSFNSSQFLLFKNNIRYDVFYRRRLLPEIYKIQV